MKATLARLENERVHLHSLTLSISLRDVHVPDVGLADLDSGTGRKGDGFTGGNDLAFPFGHENRRGHERDAGNARKTVGGIPVGRDQKGGGEDQRVEHENSLSIE